MSKAEYLHYKYTTVSCISDKSKCSVYEVEDTVTGKHYIKKVFPVGTNLDVYKRLQEKDFHNIPKVYSVFEDAEGAYIIEEYISGPNLTYLQQRETPLSHEQASAWIIGLCDTISQLHNCMPPIIHRDIKPSNIIYNEENGLYLIDFDIAREYKENVERDTVHIGTRDYASPEQYGFAQTDHRSDIYSLGALLCYMITLSPPDKASYSNEDILPPIIRKCTAIDPLQRYQSVHEVKKALINASEPAKKGFPKWAKISLLLLLCVLIFVAGFRLGGQKFTSQLNIRPNIERVTGTEMIVSYTIVDGDNRFYGGGGINRAAAPIFSGSAYEKVMSYDGDISGNIMTYYFYVSDPYNPFLEGDTLDILIPSDLFWEEENAQNVSLTITGLEDTDIPDFILSKELLSASRQEVVVRYTLIGDNLFSDSVDIPSNLRYNGNFISKAKHPSVILDDNRTITLTFVPLDSTYSFVNGDDLSVIFLPSAFDIKPNRAKETLAVMIEGIE